MTLSEDIVTMWGDDGGIAREYTNCEGTLFEILVVVLLLLE